MVKKIRLPPAAGSCRLQLRVAIVWDDMEKAGKEIRGLGM